MKKMSVKKLGLLISIDLIIVINLLVFIITSINKKEVFHSTGWWLAYALVMVPLLAVTIGLLVTKENERLQSPFLPLLAPVSGVILLVGIILLFFGAKLHFLIPLLILIVFMGFIVMGFILGGFYQSHVKNEEVKEVKVIDMEGLVDFLNNLTNNSEENIRKTAGKLLTLANQSSSKEEDELNKLEKRIFEITYFMDRDLREGKKDNFFFHANQMEKLLKERVS